MSRSTPEKEALAVQDSIWLGRVRKALCVFVQGENSDCIIRRGRPSSLSPLSLLGFPGKFPDSSRYVDSPKIFLFRVKYCI